MLVQLCLFLSRIINIKSRLLMKIVFTIQSCLKVDKYFYSTRFILLHNSTSDTFGVNIPSLHRSSHRFLTFLDCT